MPKKYRSTAEEILDPKESVMEVPEAEPEPRTSIIIFMESGKTFTFHDVNILVSNEGMLIFNYFTAFDGTRKHFEAQKSNFVGHTVFPV